MKSSRLFPRVAALLLTLALAPVACVFPQAADPEVLAWQERAAEIAVGTVAVFLAADGRLETVIFCCFGEASVKAHEKAMRVLG